MKNVILNSFQDLMNSTHYETLKYIQGDKKAITIPSPKGVEISLFMSKNEVSPFEKGGCTQHYMVWCWVKGDFAVHYLPYVKV